jgi:hypothetical protein
VAFELWKGEGQELFFGSSAGVRPKPT